MNELLEKSATLRNDVTNILTWTSSEAVESELLAREEFRNMIQEADHEEANQIDFHRKRRRTLDAEYEWQGTDIKKLKSLFWSLKNAEKELRFRSQS